MAKVDRRPRDGDLPPLDGGRHRRQLGRPARGEPSAGFDEDGVPMGIQFIGRFGEDQRVLEFALRYEQVTGSATRQRPSASHALDSLGRLHRMEALEETDECPSIAENS